MAVLYSFLISFVPSFFFFFFLLLLKIYSRLLVIRWRLSGKSRSQQEIKAISSSTFQNDVCSVY